MMTDAVITISIMIGYFVLNACIIKVSTQKQIDLETYAVGNRSFGVFLNAFSVVGAWYVGAVYVGWSLPLPTQVCLHSTLSYIPQ